MTRPPTPDARPCPWPTCPKRTKAAYLMCREHWYMLPEDIRARINETYRPGQNALTASPAYRAALRDALDYARHASRNPDSHPEMTPVSRQLYAVLPIPAHPPYPRPCPVCGGHGVTGDRYEMATDGGPILLVDVICPDCGGCGNGDPEHTECTANAHAYPDEYGADDDDQADNDGGPACYSCGSGRGWNAVQGIGQSDDGDPEGLAVLRVPCGCSADRLVIGFDPDALASAPEVTPDA